MKIKNLILTILFVLIIGMFLISCTGIKKTGKGYDSVVCEAGKIAVCALPASSESVSPSPTATGSATPSGSYAIDLDLDYPYPQPLYPEPSITAECFPSATASSSPSPSPFCLASITPTPEGSAGPQGTPGEEGTPSSTVSVSSWINQKLPLPCPDWAFVNTEDTQLRISVDGREITLGGGSGHYSGKEGDISVVVRYSRNPTRTQVDVALGSTLTSPRFTGAADMHVRENFRLPKLTQIQGPGVAHIPEINILDNPCPTKSCTKETADEDCKGECYVCELEKCRTQGSCRPLNTEQARKRNLIGSCQKCSGINALNLQGEIGCSICDGTDAEPTGYKNVGAYCEDEGIKPGFCKYDANCKRVCTERTCENVFGERDYTACPDPDRGCGEPCCDENTEKCCDTHPPIDGDRDDKPRPACCPIDENYEYECFTYTHVLGGKYDNLCNPTTCPEGKKLCPGKDAKGKKTNEVGIDFCCDKDLECGTQTKSIAIFDISMPACVKSGCAIGETECAIGAVNGGKMCCKPGYECVKMNNGGEFEMCRKRCTSNQVKCSGTGKKSHVWTCCNKDEDSQDICWNPEDINPVCRPVPK